MTDNRRWIIDRLIVVGAGVVAILWATGHLPHKGGNGPASVFDSLLHQRPAEYLYVDNQRVLEYLSQLENGLSPQEQRTVSQTQSRSATVGGGGISASATDEGSQAVSETLTPTNTSRISHLRAVLKNQIMKADINALEPDQLLDCTAHMDEGQFVMLANLRLRIPRYARAYLAIQQTGAARLASPEGVKAAEFVSRLGPNPVFPVLSDGGHSVDAGLPPVRFLFPTTFGDIPHQLRPFSGDVSVFGLVLRRVLASAPHKDRDTCTHDAVVLPDLSTSAAAPPFDLNPYVDRQTRASVSFALGSLPKFFKKRYGPTRSDFVSDIQAATRVDPPGIVILPIAILRGAPEQLTEVGTGEPALLTVDRRPRG